MRYSVNLARDEISRRKGQRGLGRMITVCLLLLVVALWGTLSVYFARQIRISTLNKETHHLLSRVEEVALVTPQKIERLRKDSNDLAMKLDLAGQTIDDCISWPRVLVSLMKCCDPRDLQLRMISTRKEGSAVVMRVEGVCTAGNAASRVEAFLNAAAASKDLGRGTVRAIRKEREEEPIVFEVEIPLKVIAEPASPGGRKSEI